MQKLGFLWILISSILLFEATCDNEALNGTDINNTGEKVSETTTLEQENVTTIRQEKTTIAQTVPPTKHQTTTLVHQIELRITSDICNLSLAIPSETKEVKMVRCKCDTLDIDVDCSYLELTELPPLISFPKTARFAQFVGNKIANIKNDTFYNGKSIQELDLSYNRIDFISVVAFKSFRSLKRLDLSHNRIWTVQANSFQGLNQLESLNLAYNDISDVFSDVFVTLTKLKELSLETNPIHELPPKLFEHLSNLEVLDLASLLMQVIPDHIFVFSPKLKILRLANNRLMEVPTEALYGLDHLKTLDLSGNPIKVIEEETFRGLRTLVILYLDNMPELTKIEKYAFGDLQLLQELHCSYNFFLTELSPLAFVRKLDNTKIRPSQVFLRQNSISTLSKDTLSWSDDLELHIQDNPLSCDCRLDWMIHLKLKNDFQNRARCASPIYLSDMSLKQLKGHELTCGFELSEIVIISVAVVIAVLILVLIAAFIVWRRSYPQYRKQYSRVSKRMRVDVVDYNNDNAI